MEIVCPAWHPGAQTLVEAVPLLADQGVTAIEVWFECGDYFDHRDTRVLETLMQRLSANGIRTPSVHSPFGPKWDISSPEDDIHERGVEALIESIELATVLGADKVIVHPSDVVTNGRSRRMERARGVLREVGVIAKESGLMLAMENLAPQYLGHTPDEVFDLLDGTDRETVAICFDSGHANLSGSFLEFANALLPRSVATHLHDNDGTSDQHNFPGTGSINWHAFASAYRASRCEASIMLECAPPENTPWSAAFQRLRQALGE